VSKDMIGPSAHLVEEAIAQDELQLGRSLSEREREAFRKGFLGEDLEVHHAAPRCLLRLYDEAHAPGELDGAAIQGWLEWEWECLRWGVPVSIARADLERLVEASTVLLEKERHRLIHGNDWQRWGRRGGRATLRKYGTAWFSLLALRRWGRVSYADLEAARSVRG
jgi:hypothetical protein